jgi:hypothetical protein
MSIFWLKSTRVFPEMFLVLSDTKVEFPINFNLRYCFVFSQAVMHRKTVTWSPVHTVKVCGGVNM